MNTFFDDHTFDIGSATETPFLNKIDIYQDGTTPMYRDTDGKLWAMSGHSHKGHIAMFCGTSLDDMKYAWRAETNFCVGNAEYAFDKIKYPEGVKARGSIWPFGLYICPNTHRFFCFFHNETGWNGKGTAYDSFGYCEKPHFDSDFRHIGLMHSDDEGKNWTFDRWVLTANHVCFTEKFIPDGINAIGQKAGSIGLGSGDFSFFVEPDGEYMYLIYNIAQVNMDKEAWEHCDTYIARARKRTDGIMGDFVKYYDGAFCEAGNLGRESIIIYNTWHTRVVYAEKYGLFFATSSPLSTTDKTAFPADIMEIRTSKDMINWSDPATIEYDGKLFGNHYMAIISDDADVQPNIVVGDNFSILTNHNGTDVMRYKTRIVEK